MKKIVANWKDIYEKNTQEKDLFQWIRHYIQAGFQVSLFVKPEEIAEFSLSFPEGRPLMVHTKDENSLELNITDYLLEWFVDDQDQFVLLKPMATNWTETGVIGRVFQVAVENQDPLTTFEIPDFIQYRHEKHSAFVQHGLFTGSGSRTGIEPSNRWVCFSTTPSAKQCSLQYYQNNLLTNPEKTHAIGKRVYAFYHMNVVVQKDKRYGIIWHPKCGCTTIMKTFCSVNSISLQKDQSIRSINFFMERFRYNVYLEEMDYIHFVRNPYHRFLSTFLDKHVFFRDDIFVQLQGYQEFKEKYNRGSLMDLCLFLKEGKYISEHYMPQSKIVLSPEIPTFAIDDNRGLNHYLTAFLKRFHPKMDLLSSLACFENSIQAYSLDKKTEKNTVSWLKHFSREEWLDYLNKNNLDYAVLLDDELKRAIYTLYKEDFDRFEMNPDLPEITPLLRKIHYNEVQRGSIGIVDDFNPDWIQIG